MLPLHLDEDWHISVVGAGLLRLIPEGSFARRVWQQLGDALHYLVEQAWEGEEFAGHHSAKALFEMSSGDGWTLDPEWLADESGVYRDDDGVEIPAEVERSYSTSEQMAVYGLWVMAYRRSIGDVPDDVNAGGWRRADVIQHRAACLLLGHQALRYAQVLSGEYTLPCQEKARIDKAMIERIRERCSRAGKGNAGRADPDRVEIVAELRRLRDDGHTMKSAMKLLTDPQRARDGEVVTATDTATGYRFHVLVDGDVVTREAAARTLETLWREALPDKA